MESIFGPLDQALRFLGSHADLWVYGTLFVAAAAEMLFPPFPGDVVFLSGMVLAGGGALAWPVVFILSCVGGLAGAWMLYELGRWKGRSWFSRPDRRIFNPRVLARFDEMFGRYGTRVIIISRFLPGIRSAVPLAAGVARLPRWSAAGYMTLSIISWNGLLAGIGFAFGSNWEAVTSFVTIYNRLVITALILLAIGWGIWVYKKAKRGKQSADNGA